MSRFTILLAVAGAASSQLTMDGVRCGQLTCFYEEYCSPETNRCAPCSAVCNKTHHNYDSGLCVKECQGNGTTTYNSTEIEINAVAQSDKELTLIDQKEIGYLLDLRYLKRSEYEPPTLNNDNAQRQAQTALIVSGVALAVLLLVLIIVCRRKISWRSIKQRFQPPKNQIKHYPSELTHHNAHADFPRPKHELKLEIRNPEPAKRTTQPLNVKDLETRTSQTDKSQGATTPKTVSTAISNRHPAEDTTLDFSYDNMAMNVNPPEQPESTNRF